MHNIPEIIRHPNKRDILIATPLRSSENQCPVLRREKREAPEDRSKVLVEKVFKVPASGDDDYGLECVGGLRVLAYGVFICGLSVTFHISLYNMQIYNEVKGIWGLIVRTVECINSNLTPTSLSRTPHPRPHEHLNPRLHRRIHNIPS